MCRRCNLKHNRSAAIENIDAINRFCSNKNAWIKNVIKLFNSNLIHLDLKPGIANLSATYELLYSVIFL